MVETLLAVEELRVDYVGVTAVHDVSFEVEAGMVYGLIGPNGAGKTSTMQAIATLVEPTCGQVRLCGVSVLEEPTSALPRLGFMPDLPPIYEDLTVFEFLDLFASSYGLPRSVRHHRIDELLELTQLTEKRDAMGGGLSRGMKQRLFLTKALLHDPAVLILDEPASGLDPIARNQLTAIIRMLGQAGKAVLVSSHILSEMETFCNSVGIMEAGRMVVSGRIDDVLKQVKPGRSMRVELVSPDDRLGSFLAEQLLISELSIDSSTASFNLDGGLNEAAALLRTLVNSEFALADFTEQEGSLQDIFMQVSSGRTS
jgi:ABC-2 type transport system ATP-binding protein